MLCFQIVAINDPKWFIFRLKCENCFDSQIHLFLLHKKPGVVFFYEEAVLLSENQCLYFCFLSFFVCLFCPEMMSIIGLHLDVEKLM